MSDEFDEYIDWSKGDQLDACYDPAIGGMGLDRPPRSFSPASPQRKGVSPPWIPLASTHKKGVGFPQTAPGTTTVPGDFWDAADVLGSLSDAPSTINYDGNLSRNAAEQSFPAVPYTNGPDSTKTWANTVTRPVSPCRECGLSFPGNRMWSRAYEKESHAKSSNHDAYGCQVTNCDKTFVRKADRDTHEGNPHVSGHGRIFASAPHECIECEEAFRRKADLLRHSKETQYQPYGCECGAQFSRADVLNRHLESVDTEDPKHPCKYCKLHRGSNGFRRLDHLKQHLRSYHHLELDDEKSSAESRLQFVFPVCPHPDCPHYRDEEFKQLPRKAQAENKPFNSQSAYTKHMRDEHNECSFPCDVPGCAHTGRRGYFREKDLLNHRRQEHPDAPKYVVPKRDFRIACTEPGCRSVLDPTSMTRHGDMHRRNLRREERVRKEAVERITASAPQQAVQELGLSAPTSQGTQRFRFLDLRNDLDHQQQQAPFNF